MASRPGLRLDQSNVLGAFLVDLDELRNTAIEGSQLAFAMLNQRDKIGVSDLSMTYQCRASKDFCCRRRDIAGPESMPRYRNDFL